MFFGGFIFIFKWAKYMWIRYLWLSLSFNKDTLHNLYGIVALWLFTLSIKSFFMMTSSNGNIIRVTGPLCREFTGQSPVNSPHKRQWRGALMFSLICALKKRLSKQSWCLWFETPSRPSWRHCNVFVESQQHYDIWRKMSWWRHQMETFSALLVLCEGNPPVDSPHKGQWRGAVVFSLICA